MQDDIKNLNLKIYRAFGQIIIIFSIGTFGFNYLLEDITLLEALYLTIITLTTVGYGDITPLANAHPDEKTNALVFAIGIMIFGMSAFVYAAGILTQYVTSGQLKRNQRIKKMQKKINRYNDHFLIIGASETGCYIADELKVLERQFVLIDSSQKALDAYADKDRSITYLRGDATEEETLIQAGLARAKRVAITLPDPKDTLFLIMTLKELSAENNWHFEILSKCPNEMFARKLKLAGADIIIKSDITCSEQVITELFRPTSKTFMDRLNNDASQVVRIDEVTISGGSSIQNVELKKSKISKTSGLHIFAIKEFSTGGWMLNPHGGYQLKQGDVLVFIGNLKSAQKLRRLVENV